VLDATKKFEKLITDKKEIEGLPATALGLAAQTAVSKVLPCHKISVAVSSITSSIC
jgi:Zn-dependent oligopeptidase